MTGTGTGTMIGIGTGTMTGSGTGTMTGIGTGTMTGIGTGTITGTGTGTMTGIGTGTMTGTGTGTMTGTGTGTMTGTGTGTMTGICCKKSIPNYHVLHVLTGGACTDGLSNCAAYGQNMCQDQQYHGWAVQNCCAFCHLSGKNSLSGKTTLSLLGDTDLLILLPPIGKDNSIG
jgi:hypothetical protein